MVATPPSAFLNVLGSLVFTFTLAILLFALVLRLVLLTMAMTRAMVLVPPPRDIGFVRRRRSVIAGPHLGRSTSLRFLLSTCLIEFNRNKTVMLDENVVNLQVQIEIAGVRLQLMVERVLRLHQRGYRLALRSELLIVHPNEICRVMDDGFRMRIITNVGRRICKRMELVTAGQEKRKTKTY